jgi:hypothetical protein
MDLAGSIPPLLVKNPFSVRFSAFITDYHRLGDHFDGLSGNHVGSGVGLVNLWLGDRLSQFEFGCSGSKVLFAYELIKNIVNITIIGLNIIKNPV